LNSSVLPTRANTNGAMAYTLVIILSFMTTTTSVAFEFRKSSSTFLRKRVPARGGQSSCNGPAFAGWAEAFAGLAPHKHDNNISPAYQPRGNSTLLVESDISAWNNVRMSWETAVCLAFKTRRLYRVPQIPVDTYADIRLKFMQNGKLRKLNMFDYYDEDSFRRVIPATLDSDPLLDGKVFYPDKDPWALPIEQLTGPDYTHLVYKEGPGHIATRVFTQYAAVENFKPHEDYVRLIQNAFRLRQDVICKTIERLVSYDLSPLSYVALHRRQGDTVNIQSYNVSATAAAQHVADLVRNKTVLVVTDTYEPDFLEQLRKLSGAYRVVCWADKKWEGDDSVFAAQIDMLAAVGAREFIGSPSSTFSTGIIRWRTQAGTHRVGEPVHFTEQYSPGYEGWPSPGARGTYF